MQLCDESTGNEAIGNAEVVSTDSSENNDLDREDTLVLGSTYLPDDRLDGRDMMSGKRPPPMKKFTMPSTVRGFADIQSPFGVFALVGQPFGHTSSTRSSGNMLDFGSIGSAWGLLDMLLPS